MIDLKNGDMLLCFNYEIDELFLIKRGCIFSYWLLEDSHGTSFYKKYDDFIKSSTLLNEYVIIDNDF